MLKIIFLNKIKNNKIKKSDSKSGSKLIQKSATKNKIGKLF